MTNKVKNLESRVWTHLLFTMTRHNKISNRLKLLKCAAKATPFYLNINEATMYNNNKKRSSTLTPELHRLSYCPQVLRALWLTSPHSGLTFSLLRLLHHPIISAFQFHRYNDGMRRERWGGGRGAFSQWPAAIRAAYLLSWRPSPFGKQTANGTPST